MSLQQSLQQNSSFVEIQGSFAEMSGCFEDKDIVLVTRVSSTPVSVREKVMSHVGLSHVTHVKGSCHKYEWKMSRVESSYCTRGNESCHACE